MRFRFLCLNTFISLLGCYLNAQHIVVNPSGKLESTYAPSELVSIVLEPECSDYKSFSAVVAGDSSFGYFEKGHSGFPLERGVVLSTGNVNSLQFENLSLDLTTSDPSIGGGYVVIDEILDVRIGNDRLAQQSVFTTLFVTPQTDLFSLRYIFASESYGQPDNIGCFNGNNTLQDGFAVIIHGPGIVPDTYDHDNDPATPEIEYIHGGKNIALLPDGITEVGLHSVHNNPFCSNTGFPEYYLPIPLGSGPIALNGMTVPLTASSPVIPGETYEVEVIITNRGDHTLDSALFLEAPPAKPIVQFDQTYVCVDETGRAIAPFSTLDTGIRDNSYSFNWFLDRTLLPGEHQSSLTPLQQGTYTVEVTGPAGCSDFYDAQVHTSSPPFGVNHAIEGELFTNNQRLSVSVSGTGNYQYILDNRPPQTNPVFENVSPGFHGLNVTDLNGCGSQNLDIYVLDYPRFFTPNGDGINDTWSIDLQQIGGNGNIFIFDRFGKLLKQLNTNSTGWDGTFNNKPLPSSDYWFHLKLDDGRSFKSHFCLKR